MKNICLVREKKHIFASLILIMLYIIKTNVKKINLNLFISCVENRKEIKGLVSKNLLVL